MKNIEKIDIPLAFRDSAADDENLILSAILKGYKKKKSALYITQNKTKAIIEQGHFTAFMPSDIYFTRFKPLLMDKILPSATTIIAHNPDHSDQIYGFVTYSSRPGLSVYTYLYVKKPFRCFNIGRALFELTRSNTNAATYYAPWLHDIYKKNNILFDPFFDLEK